MTIMPESNKSDLRLRDLKVLSVLLEQPSLTGAAETLGMTQPSVSKVLARLRRHFDDPLLLRSGQNMRPTARALEIAAPLRALLATAEGMRAPQTTFNALKSERTFRILVSDVGMIRFLPPLMAHVEREGSKLRLDAVPLGARDFAAKLESGEADLALGAFPKAPRHLRRQRLYVDGYVGVARHDRTDLADLKSRAGFHAAGHIMVTASETGHAAHQAVQDSLEATLAPERILLRLPSFIAAAVVASRTDGIAILPTNVATFIAAQLGLATFRCPIPLPPIEIAQYWHERQHRDPGHQWLRHACFDLFARPGRAKSPGAEQADSFSDPARIQRTARPR